MQYIDEFMQDLQLGVHALELVAEIIRDNPKLTSFNIKPIVDEICSQINALPIENPKKATFLSFLRVFMEYDGHMIKDNQYYILN